MSISSPVTPPAALKMARMTIHANSVVGESRSPFTMEEQEYVHPGEWWEADVQVPSLDREDAYAVRAFLLSLNGKEHYFSLGPGGESAPLGSWSGSPVVNGAHAAGVKVLSVSGLNTGATGVAGDWIQIGNNLHQLVVGFTVGSPQIATLEIWPRTRAALVGSEAITVNSAKGIWRLASNRRSWDVGPGPIYDIRFSCVEALNP